MIVKQLPVGEIQTNCYIAGCETTHEGVVIDPGDEAERILAITKTRYRIMQKEKTWTSPKRSDG